MLVAVSLLFTSSLVSFQKVASEPLIAWIPPTTLIAGQSVQGPVLRLRSGKTATWSVVDPPKGLSVDKGGRVTWVQPTTGKYRVHFQTTVGNDSDEGEWWVQVVESEYPDAVVYSTKFIDFVVPRECAVWFRANAIETYVDKWYSWMRDQIGQDLNGGRQSFVLRSSLPNGEGGLSGNPAQFTPVWWGKDDADHWQLGTVTHEVGHNFHHRMNTNGAGSDTMFPIVHHLLAFDGACFDAIALSSLGAYVPANRAAFVERTRRVTERQGRQFTNFQKDVGQGKSIESARGGHGAWASLSRLYVEKFGALALLRVIRSFRIDALPEGFNSSDASDVDKYTLIFALMSASANQDLRSAFRSYGFPVNDGLFNKLIPVATTTVRNLPDPDIAGWKRSPVNGHYYRLTPWAMTWTQSDRCAKLFGGRLARVRSKAEQDWLAKSFLRNPKVFKNTDDLWLDAIRDQSGGVVKWASGETGSFLGWAQSSNSGATEQRETTAVLDASLGGLWTTPKRNARKLGLMERDQAPGPADDPAAGW